MLTERFRDLTITLAALAVFSAAPAMACTIILTPNDERRSERAAFRKADLVVTVDALSESYMPVPGAFAGTLRVGVGTGRVVEVHKGHGSFEDQVLRYVVADGEDALSCPALRSARPGRRYKLYLIFASESGPPTIIYRDPFFD